MNPTEIVNLRDKILNLYAEKLICEQEIAGYDEATAKLNEELKADRDAKMQGKLDEGNAGKARSEREYKAKCDKVESMRKVEIDRIEASIKKAQDKFLDAHDHMLEPVRNFDRFDKEQEKAEVGLPRIETPNDILDYNDKVEKLYDIQQVGQVRDHADKAVWVLKPVEMVIGHAGEDKRMFVELGYVVVLGAVFTVYSAYLLPLGITATSVYGVKRYMASSKINKHWETYHQVMKYKDKILGQMETALLSSNEDTIESYRNKSVEAVKNKYPMPAKGAGPGEIDASDIDKQFLVDSNDLAVAREQGKKSLIGRLEVVKADIIVARDEMAVYQNECAEKSWAFPEIVERKRGEKRDISRCTLPDYAHLGTVRNTKYEIEYPYMHPVIENSLCVYYDVASRESVVNFVKYYMMQLWIQVDPKIVRYRLLDTKDFGAEFSDIIVKSTDLIDLTTDVGKGTELLTEATDELKRRNVEMLRRFDTVTQYNKAMAEQDANLASYDVYVNINPTKEQLLSTQNQSLIKQASSCGIFIINIVSDELVYGNEKDTEELLTMLNAHGEVIAFEDNSIVTGLQLSEDETFSAIEIAKAEYVKAADEMYKRVESVGIDTLWYGDLLDRNFPEQWTKIPTKDIDFCVGNLNGEMDKAVFLKLGDTNPHALLAGATGQGKSVLLNSMLLSISQMYSPDWVQMYLLDFKGTEMLFYGKPCVLPHLRAVSATRDIKYVLSVFNDILWEMEARNKLFDGILGIKNYEEFCKGMLAGRGEEFWEKITDGSSKKLQTMVSTPHGKRLIDSMTMNKEYPVLPRILFCIDEFADMFLIGDDFKDQVSKLISSLAKKSRSAGIHMVFASQNMEGTVPENVLEQFKLRICVPCSAGVSSALLGNRAASAISKGYAVANNEPDQGDKYNQLIKVAFELTPDIEKRIKQMSEKRPIKIQIYDESEAYDYTYFQNHIARYRQVQTSNTYILGEPREFQRKSIPITMSMTFKERQNMAVLAMDKDEMNGLTMCILDNLKHKNIKTFMFTGDDEFECSREYLGDDCVDYRVGIDPDYVYDFIEANQGAREANDNRTPLYFVLHSLQSVVGFGVDTFKRDLHEYLKENMLKLNSLGIFFILCSTQAKSIRQCNPSITHFIIGNLEERDVGFAPEIVYKTIRNISENEAFYVDTATSKSKAFKPYTVFESIQIDEDALFE